VIDEKEGYEYEFIAMIQIDKKRGHSNPIFSDLNKLFVFLILIQTFADSKTFLPDR
jgi:hypothetical protein